MMRLLRASIVRRGRHKVMKHSGMNGWNSQVVAQGEVNIGMTGTSNRHIDKGVKVIDMYR